MKATPLLLALASFAAIFVASGCATTSIRNADGKPVPAKRITQKELMTPSSERTAKVSFVRGHAFIGAGCTHRILIDGHLAFSIRPGEMQAIYLAPGQHFFGLESGGGMCPNTASSESTVLGPHDEEAYRVIVSPYSDLRLTRIK